MNRETVVFNNTNNQIDSTLFSLSNISCFSAFSPYFILYYILKQFSDVKNLLVI